MHTTRPGLSIEAIQLENTQQHEVSLHLLPWGEQYRLLPGEAVEVLARGPAGDALDLDWSDDSITVYGWPGSVVYVQRDGRDLAPASGGTAERHPVPRLPPQMRLREYLDAMSAPLP